jgi:ABC-2 type transport system permease protein
MGAKSVVSHSLRIAWKDLMELLRNRMGLVMLVLMPVFMMGLVGFIFPSSTSISDVSVVLVNEDEGNGSYPSASAMLIAALEQMNNSTGMMVITEASNLGEARELIQRGEAEGGIVIASNFTSSLISGKQGAITIVTDESNPQMSALLQTVMKEVFEQIGTWLAQQNVQGLSPD